MRASVLLAAGIVAHAIPWTNWANNWHFNPLAVYTNVSTEAGVLEYVRNASNVRIKVLGAGHSFSAILGELTDGIMLNFVSADLTAVTRIAPNVVRAHAGLHIHELNAVLESKWGLALPNLGAISMQTLGGATATCTHGTGNTGCLSSFVRGLRMVLANGTVVFANATNAYRDLFRNARAGWGALGIVTEIDLEVVPMFHLEQILAPMPMSQLLAGLPVWLQQYPRLQWYYTPYDENSGYLLVRQNTTAAITGCWNGTRYTTIATPPPSGLAAWPAGTTACTDVSYKAMTRDGDDTTLYTEIEIMVDVANSTALVNDYRALLETMKPQWNSSVELFMGMRYVLEDDIPLSPFYKRNSSVLSFIVFGEGLTIPAPSDQVYLFHSELHKLGLTNYIGRPHPGKNHYLSRGLTEDAWPDSYDDFAAVRTAIDPQGLWMNSLIQLIFGGC